MSRGSRLRFAEVVRREPVDIALACALVAAEAEPDTEPDVELANLDALATRASERLTHARGGRPWPSAAGTGGRPASGGTLTVVDLAMAAEALRAVLGGEEELRGGPEDYGLLESSLLSAVLRRRRGLPIILSVVWLEVARRAGIPAYPIALPGHVIVGVGSPELGLLVDPFDGGRTITVHEAAEKVRAAGSAFLRAHLAPAASLDLVMRILTNIRLWAARADVPRTRLWAVELSLLLPHHPASLRRERGELLVRLGDYRSGAADLEAFADAVAPVEPASAEAARRNALAARARLN